MMCGRRSLSTRTWRGAESRDAAVRQAFRTVVNEYLRTALSSRPRDPVVEPPFVVQARDLGALRPGLALDNVGDLLEAAEGPLHR
jgi:hypothetical protein